VKLCTFIAYVEDDEGREWVMTLTPEPGEPLTFEVTHTYDDPPPRPLPGVPGSSWQPPGSIDTTTLAVTGERYSMTRIQR
jgi:hypothetical protein